MTLRFDLVLYLKFVNSRDDWRVTVMSNLTKGQKICIAISAIGLIFLIGVGLNIDKFSGDSKPYISNFGYAIQTVEADGVTYTLARSKDKSPDLTALREASKLDTNNSNIQTTETASGESRESLELSETDRQKAVKLLQKYVSHMKKNSVYYTLTYSDGSIDIVLNNRGNEELSELGAGGVSGITAGGTFYQKSETGVYKAESMTSVSILENVLDRALKDPDHVSVTAVEAGEDDDGNKYTSYRVTFDSAESYIDVYKNFDDDKKQSLVDSLKQTVKQYSDEDPKICFEFLAGNDWSLSVYNTIILGDDYILNWYFDGYYEIFDWSLADGFYDGDVDDMQTYDNLLDTELSSLGTMINVYQATTENPDTGKLKYNADLQEKTDDSDSGEDSSFDVSAYQETLNQMADEANSSNSENIENEQSDIENIESESPEENDNAEK